MTIASFPSRLRRVLLFCAVTLLLHWAALGWVGAHVAPLAQQAPAPQPVMIVAQLHLAPPPKPEPAQAAPPPRPKPARPKPRPKPPAPPPADPAPGMAAAPDLVAPAASEPATDGDPAKTGAASAAAEVQSPQPQAEVRPAEPAAPPEPPVPAAPPAPAETQPRRFKARVPPSGEMSMAVARTDRDGTEWVGEASMVWTLTGASYRIKVEAGVSMLIARVNLVEQTSEGSVGANGFVPLTLTDKRRGRSQTATHFDYPGSRITFSTLPNQYQLYPGAQDTATLPLQLSAIARADASQLAGEFDIQVGEDRWANVFRFVVVGQEEISTGLGKMLALHLSRPPRQGTYHSQLDVWLAPAYDWYPVQIRNTEANGAVTTQTVKKITVTDPQG